MIGILISLDDIRAGAATAKRFEDKPWYSVRIHGQQSKSGQGLMAHQICG